MRNQNSELQDKVETSSGKKQSLSEDMNIPDELKPEPPSARSSPFDKSKLIPSLKKVQSSTDNVHVKLYVDLFDSYDADGNGTLDITEAKQIFGDFVEGIGFWWSKMFPLLIQANIFRQTSETDEEVDEEQVEAYMSVEMETCHEDIEKMKEHLRGPGLKAFMSHVDKDHDGVIEKDEWRAFVVEALSVLTPRIVKNGKSPHENLQLQLKQLRRLASDEYHVQSQLAPALKSMSGKLND